MGATLALPLLDSMVPALSAMAKTSANPVRRLGFIYFPHGSVTWMPGNGNTWTPQGELRRKGFTAFWGFSSRARNAWKTFSLRRR